MAIRLRPCMIVSTSPPPPVIVENCVCFTILVKMETIDWESQQLKVLNALKEGNLALQQLHEEMPLEKVEELMADTAESIAMEEVGVCRASCCLLYTSPSPRDRG